MGKRNDVNVKNHQTFESNLFEVIIGPQMRQMSTMGTIDSLTELAKTLDAFFKGLSECNLLSTYSVQLQASSVNYTKFCLLVHQFMKNLRCLLVKIPIAAGHETWKDVDTQTDNHSEYVEVNVTSKTSKESRLNSIVGACVIDSVALIENKINDSKDQNEVQQSFSHPAGIIVTCDPKSLAAIVNHDFITTEESPTSIKNETKEGILGEFLQDSTTTTTSTSTTTTITTTINSTTTTTTTTTSTTTEGKVLEDTPCEITDLIHVVVTSADAEETNSAIFICEACDKSFNSARTLEQHLSFKHGHKENKGDCDLCSQTFSSVLSLQEHCRTQHRGTGCFTCSICKRRLMTRLSYRRHMDTHNGKKGAVCDVCGKMFSRADYLQKHYMTHTGTRPHACEHCSRRFLNTSQLRVHERMHTGAREHVCDTCNKAFSRMDKLKDHMLRHLNIKRFRCSMCQKGYAEKRDLTKHLKVHNVQSTS